jgi:two-component system phosphate regulon sensor histidine kinase PhoR
VKGSIFGRSFALVSAAVIASCLLIATAGLAVMSRAYVASNAESLVRAATAAADVVSMLPGWMGSDGDMNPIATFAAEYSKNSGYRITYVDADGIVIFDSQADSAAMGNHLDRQEIAGALAGKASWARRRSTTTGAWMLYAASPVRDARGQLRGILRLAVPLPDMMEALGSARRVFIAVAIAIALFTLAASAAFMNLLVRPIRALSGKAQQYAGAGDALRSEGRHQGAAPVLPGGRLGPGAPAELHALETSLDSMAQELSRRETEAKEMGERYSRIVASAAEAILALDVELRVLEANPAAQAMFGLSPESLSGRPVTQIPGGSALAALATASMRLGNIVTQEIELYQKPGTTLRISASPLGGAHPGVVLTATDISMMKRLETMRKDFVANVSHELRTPIHLIKGFAEALKSETPDGSSGKYIEIIERNAARMERIVADLLQLARIERDPAGWLNVESCTLGDICRAAFETISFQASAKSLEIIREFDPEIRFAANAGLVEQAIENLLENAIRYSPESSNIILESHADGDFVEISVRDKGPGIPAPDLDRIFERFYRADKSRDRKSGGTGLGLAIVRHIALAHGGSVSAESWAGEGSRFVLRFPVHGPQSAQAVQSSQPGCGG